MESHGSFKTKAFISRDCFLQVTIAMVFKNWWGCVPPGKQLCSGLISCPHPHTPTVWPGSFPLRSLLSFGVTASLLLNCLHSRLLPSSIGFCNPFVFLNYSKVNFLWLNAAAAAAKSLQSCPTLQPHRRQPTRLPHPWDSPGKNTGVGCHFLLQCMKVNPIPKLELIPSIVLTLRSLFM